MVVLFWLDLWQIFFLPTLGFELGTSGSLVMHSNTVPWRLNGFHLWQFQVFNSGAVWFEGGIVLIGPLRDFLFVCTLGFELGTSGSLVLHSTTVIMATSGFHLWQFQVFNSGAEGLVVVLFSLHLWQIFFLPTLGFEPGISRSLVLHYYHCCHTDFWFLPLTISGI